MGYNYPTFIRYLQIANGSKPTRNGSFIYGSTHPYLLASTTDCHPSLQSRDA